MLRLLGILIIVLPGSLLAQKSQIYELRGIVSIFNSKFETGVKQYVNKAQVSEVRGKSNAATTGSNGFFELTVVEMETNQSFQFNVQKEGLAVVNDTELFATVGQLDTVRIYMARIGKIADDKTAYHKIGKTNSVRVLEQEIKDYKARVNKLERTDVQNRDLLLENQRTIAGLNKKIEELQKRKTEVDTDVDKLAQLFSVMNMDEASEDHKNALRLFKGGYLKEALELLERSAPSAKADRIIADRKRIDAEDRLNTERQRQLVAQELFRANLYRINYEYDSAQLCYQTILRLDSVNFEALLNYGDILQEENDFTGAFPIYRRALGAARTLHQQAEVHNRLGGIYSRLNQQHDKARRHYLSAVHLFERISSVLPDNKSIHASLANALMDLGLLYRHMDMQDSTLVLYRSAINVYERMTSADRQTYVPILARHYKAFGSLYRDFNAFDSCEYFYLKALHLQDSLDIISGGGYSFDVSETNNSMGKLYTYTKQWKKAEDCFNNAIRIRKILADYYPATYNYHLADSYHLLGRLYYSSNEAQKSVIAFRSALDLWKQLSEYQFEVFGIEYAKTMVTTANLFLEKYYSHRASEKFYYDALQVFRRLSSNPESGKNHEGWIRVVHYNLGLLYEYVFLPQQADRFYSLALESKFNEVLSPAERFNAARTGFNAYLRLHESTGEAVYKDQAATYLHQMKENMNKLPEEEKGIVRQCEETFERSWPAMADHYPSFKPEIPLYYCNATIEEASVYFDSAQYHLADSLSAVVVEVMENVRAYRSAAMKKSPHFTEPFNMDSALAVYQGNSSWYKLFVSDFSGAISSAKVGLQLAPNELWIYSNLGHAYMLIGDIRQARSTYQILKGKTDQYNQKHFRDILIADLIQLEKAGVVNKNIKPTINWITSSF